MRFVAKVVSQYVSSAKSREYPEEFLDALEDMQGNNYEGVDILRYHRKHPGFFETLDKGMNFPVLWRGIGLGLQEMKKFFGTGRLEETEDRIESWATSRAHAHVYLGYHNCPGSYAILFKKRVPESKRLFYTKPIPESTEDEIVCLPQVLMKDDIASIYLIINTTGDDSYYIDGMEKRK